MAVSASEQKALANLARAANRRLERASAGQRSYLEQQIRRYHVRQRGSGAIVFQQGKAKTEAEYAARMRELERFMQAKTSTRRGWESQKKAQVAAAGETLRKDGANITDEELALTLQEIGEGHGSAEFYKALANVEIAKSEQGASWDPSPDTISAAIAERRSAQERATALINARKRQKE